MLDVQNFEWADQYIHRTYYLFSGLVRTSFLSPNQYKQLHEYHHLVKMGSTESIHPLEKEVRADWMEVFQAMRLKKPEVMKLYEIYVKVDCDKSGSIDVVELLTLMDIERTVFTERIFSAFDKDHTGKVDFYEFVVSVWKFCTLGNSAICKLTYFPCV